MKTAKFEEALRVFQNIMAEDNPNVAKFAASVQGMIGECLFSLNRMPYVFFILNVPPIVSVGGLKVPVLIASNPQDFAVRPLRLH